MLLYVHVPFCRAKCAYCAFHSLPGPEASAVAAYAGTLLDEMRLQADRLRRGVSDQVETIFFGGGTPTLLPPVLLIRLLKAIRSEFPVAWDAEISLEANPESVPDVDSVRELTAAGFNRVSLGVQSFSNARLKTLGRLHTVAEAVDAFSRLRNGGFRNIGLDLMWGLPGQRPQAWMDELKYALELGPEHISCYGLTLEPGTPLAAPYGAPEAEWEEEGAPNFLSNPLPAPLPNEDEQARMYVYGIEYLTSRGYIQYEVSNTARMGFACRHNMGYWSGDDYLGLGPAAVSTMRGLRWTNSSDHAQWRADVAQGTISAGAETIDEKTRLFEAVMLRLRTSKGLPFTLYQKMSGRDFLRDHGRLVRLLVEKKLLSLRNRHARLTLTGMLVSNSIIEKFFERMEELA